MRIILAVIIFSFIVLSVLSCGQKGCTDKYADNYCSKCKRNDGSCIYQSKCIFWHNKATNDGLLAHNKTALYYIVNGIIVRQYIVVSTVVDAPPECSSTGMAAVGRTLKKDGSHFESFEVRDQNQNVLWNGTIDFNANSPCIVIQQEWKP